jgi:soluble lytic murein transglycosylase
MNRDYAAGDIFPIKGGIATICAMLVRVLWRRGFFTCAAFLCIMIIIAPVAYAEGIDGKAYFKQGKADLEAKRYAEAVKSFSAAQKEFPVIGDYSLLYLAEARHGLGDHRKSLENIRSLLVLYPNSPLVKKARASEIREASEASLETLVRLYEAYDQDYPDDDEINILFGSYLKKIGEQARARAVFKKIYLRAGALAMPAYTELSASDITPADFIERASNLMARYDFKEAERDLQKALSIDGGKKRAEILKNLGYALFMQKKYKESATIYEDIKDTYSVARSLYRSGDKEGFNAALKDLLKKNDKRVGNLLIAVASDKRRENDFGEAVRIYDDILNGYPSEQEEAMWGKGWTYYISADYKKSSAVFSELYAKYGNPKYLYWQAKSTEAAGSDAESLYNSLLSKENNFYSVLSYARAKEQTIRPVPDMPLPDIQPDMKPKFDRIDLLLSLSMKDEAIAELGAMLKKVKDASAMFNIISKFHEIGEFERSVGLVTKTVYSEKNHRFWYPLAYWEEVEKVAGKYRLDPLIVLSVIREESRFEAAALSVAGARGLMQIMPRTASRIDKIIGIGIKTESDLDVPANNIRIGAYYLKSLFDEFKSLAAVLAVYNAGEAAIKKWRQQRSYRSADEFIEDIPYAETRNYVKRIMTSYFQYKRYFPDMKTETGFDFLRGGL